MTKKEKKIIDELRNSATFYNHWDIDSMRMALGTIKQKLNELTKVGEKNGR